MKQGRVFQFDAARRFGWIQEESGEKWFFHLVDFGGQPVAPVGTPILFEIGSFQGRPKATNIRTLTPQEILGGVR